MLLKINPSQTSAWKKLTAHYAKIKTVLMKIPFDNDLKRFKEMEVKSNEFHFDFSKNICTNKTKEYGIGWEDEEV